MESAASRPTKNYSQSQEQEYILAACQHISGGRFLDIGAYHPTEKSNTRALYELGWSGVMIDPGPEQVKSLLLEYGNDPRATIISAAVGRERAVIEMQITDDGTSTSDPATFAKWKDICHYHGKLLVPTITLADITMQFGSFHFVSIDAEGQSVTILEDLLASTMRPKCICVEHDDRLVECSQRAFAKGYVQTYVSGENSVYTRP